MRDLGGGRQERGKSPRRRLTLVADAAPERRPRAAALLELVERPFLRLERLTDRLLPRALDPIAQSGAVANFLFLVAVLSGVLLLFWYVPSVHQAFDSVQGMRAKPFTAELARSLHRYSSDACMLFVLLHAVRYTAGKRFGGARWLAWVTGIAAIGVLWVVGWLGYWLVWDERGRQVAIGTARAVDVIPIFTDPLSRSFVSDASINSLLFFIVFFVHMLLPLLMVVAVWLHVSRLSRSDWMTGKWLSAWILLSLVLVSLVYPATSAGPAKMLEDPDHFTMDYWYLAPLLLTDRLGGGLLWASFLGLGVVLFSVPWWLARGRATAATVTPARCYACQNCSLDCPYGAITLVPRSDGRDYPTQAEVDPGKCVGCGICNGSCDSSAVGVPWMDAPSARRVMDGWLDAAVARGDRPLVAFVCASSAAERIAVDAGTGAAAELPGYVVWAMPCAGWIHPLTIERVFRHGAAGVLVAACGTHTCAYREGGRWIDERLAGARAPALRVDRVDADRVQVGRFDRDQREAFLRSARRFGAGARAVRAPAPRRRVATISTLSLMGAVLLGVTVLASDLPYAPPAIEAPELVVSFKLPGRTGEVCCEPSAEELARTPRHMRRERICARGRASVRVRVLVDGALAHEGVHEPFGLFDDGPSAAIVRIPVSEGSRRVRVSLGESLEPNAASHEVERALEFGERQRHVLRFERQTGFTWD